MNRSGEFVDVFDFLLFVYVVLRSSVRPTWRVVRLVVPNVVLERGRGCIQVEVRSRVRVDGVMTIDDVIGQSLNGAFVRYGSHVREMRFVVEDCCPNDHSVSIRSFNRPDVACEMNGDGLFMIALPNQ